jgi:hypothetical protein
MRYAYQAMVGAGGAMMRYRTREDVRNWILRSVLYTVSNGGGGDGRRLQNADRAKNHARDRRAKGQAAK